ncbi:MAG TPA: hypothetical protein VJ801_08015 [Polyangia bacterium]|jgi:hypothetical protein|nr:hypothetical protein [Polyangia bacterium]
MPQIRVVLSASLSLGVLSLVLLAEAEEVSSPTRLRCEGGAQYSLDPRIHIKSIQPPKSLPKSTRRMYRKEFGPFDEGKYGFQRIEFVVERISSGEAESVSEANGYLKVRIKMVSTAGEKWLLLGESSGEDRFTDERPADLEEGPKGKNSFATLGQAAPDPGVPIFVLAYSFRSLGMNTENSFASHELLDFRTRPPRVIMTLDCQDQEGGGACGALDLANEAEDTLDCNWAGELDGFICDEVSNPGRPWQSARRFVVGSKAVLPPPGKPEDPHDLAALAARAADDPTWVGAHPVPIAEIGHVMALHVQPVSESGTRLVLLGAPGHFFLATIRPGRQPEVRELHANDVWRDLPPPPEKQPSTPPSRERGPHLPDFAPTFPSRFDLAAIFHDESLTVLRVVVSDGGRTMFFIGIDHSGRKATTEALHLASTESNYVGCGRMARDPAAYAIRIGTKARFSARATLMPDISGGEGVSPVDEREDDRTLANSTACAWHTTVRWRSGAGFVTEHDRTRCLTVPGLSRVKIGHDGSLRLVKDRQVFDHDR